MSVRLRPEAAADIRAAMAWYDARKPGLGAEFLNETDAVFARIAERPESYPAVHGETRRALMRRFPYAVYFDIDNEGALVMAVLHQRQDRGMLSERG